MTDKSLKISYLLVPFVILSGGIIHAGHHNAIIVAGLFIVASMIKNVWIRSFMYYTCIWNVYFGLLTLTGHTNIYTLGKGMGFGFYLMITAIILIAVANSKIKSEGFYNLICIAAILQALLCVFQLAGWDPVFALYENIVAVRKGIPGEVATGTLGNNNFLALFLAISLPFFFRKMWWYFVPVMIAILCVAITSTAMVAMVIGCLYYFWPKVKKFYLGLMTLPFVVYVIITKQSLTINLFSSTHDRFDFWLQAWNQVTQSWLSIIFGLGPAAPWGHKFPLHNEWVTAFHHFGIIGCIIIAGYLITMYRKNRMLLSAFIIACIGAMGTYPIHLAPSAFLILIIIGLMEREENNAYTKCRDRFIRGFNPFGFVGKIPR